MGASWTQRNLFLSWQGLLLFCSFDPRIVHRYVIWRPLRPMHKTIESPVLFPWLKMLTIFPMEFTSQSTINANCSRLHTLTHKHTHYKLLIWMNYFCACCTECIQQQKYLLYVYFIWIASDVWIVMLINILYLNCFVLLSINVRNISSFLLCFILYHLCFSYKQNVKCFLSLNPSTVQWIHHQIRRKIM